MALLWTLLLCAPGAGPWVVYRPAEGGYSVRMPAGAEAKSEKSDQPGGEIEVRSLSAIEDGLKYAIYHHDLSAPVAAARRGSVLDALRDGLVRSNRAAIRSESKIAIEGKPGRDLVLDVALESGGAAILRVRLLLADRRVFQLYAWAPENKADRPEIAEFLGSFRLLPAAGSPFSPASAGFSARFPGPDPAESKERLAGRDWTRYEARDGALSFSVAHADPPAAALRDPRRLLDAARDELIAVSLGTLLSDRKFALGRDPAREVVADVPLGDDPKGATLTARIVLHGGRLFLVKAVAPKANPDHAATRAFLDSFRPSAR